MIVIDQGADSPVFLTEVSLIPDYKRAYGDDRKPVQVNPSGTDLPAGQDYLAGFGGTGCREGSSPLLEGKVVGDNRADVEATLK